MVGIDRVLVYHLSLEPAASSQETKHGNSDWIFKPSSLDGVLLTGHKLLG